MTAVVLSELYRELDALLEARARDYPRRVEPTWSTLIRRLDDLRATLRERSRPRGRLAPSEAAQACCERLLGSAVFIVGYKKSGTSLLRNLLDGHPELAVVPAHESSHWVSFLREHGHLPRIEQVDIVHDRWLRRFVNPRGEPPFWLLGRPWELEADPYERLSSYLYWLADRYPGQDLLGILAVAIVAARLDSGTLEREPRCWVEKSPTHELYVDEIVRTYPQARFLHIVRDPRATVAALKRLDKKEDPWLASRELQRSLDAALRYPERLGPDRYLVLRYEDLVTEPRAVMRRVADFLGVEFADGLLTATTGGQPVRANSAWEEKRVRGEIHALSLDSWGEVLGPLTVSLVERRTASRARALGYAIEEPGLRRRALGAAAAGARHLARRSRRSASRLWLALVSSRVGVRASRLVSG